MPGGVNTPGWDKKSANISLFDITDKIAIVTGAGSGIGRGIALALAGAGAEVVAMGRSVEKLEETCRLVACNSGSAWPLEVDVAKNTQIEAAFKKVIDRKGHLDILVNSAGIQLRKPALEVTEQEWNNMVSMNLKSVFFCCQFAAKAMCTCGGGKIVNISSLTAVIGLPYLSVYGMCKGGINQLNKTLAIEWAPFGINVNAIGPGRIRTPMTESLYQDDEIQKSFLSRIPLRRGGMPDDLAGTAVFLASDASNYITGQTIYVDGGWLASGGNPLS